jgi:hypothetical protein
VPLRIRTVSSWSKSHWSSLRKNSSHLHFHKTTFKTIISCDILCCNGTLMVCESDWFTELDLYWILSIVWSIFNTHCISGVGWIPILVLKSAAVVGTETKRLSILILYAIH